jgi:hypothetical protein
MSDPKLDRLGALLDLLRAKGVRVYRASELDRDGRPVGRIEVEFEPTIVDHPDAKPAPDPDRCACGHMAHEHSNGLCLHGCEPEACAPPEDPK